MSSAIRYTGNQDGFSIIKIRRTESCLDCGLCEKNCPMDIRLLEYKNLGQRILSTECIFCNTCVNVCPVSAVKMTMGPLDIVKKEHLRFRN